MRHKIGILLLSSAAMVVPAAAQQGQPNPNQAAARAILQAADKAIGASNVKSWTATATGWMGYPGQQFSEGDLPRTDLKSFNYAVDYPSKSAKWDYVRVQGNNIPRGGGAGFRCRASSTLPISSTAAPAGASTRKASPSESRPPTPRTAS